MAKRLVVCFDGTWAKADKGIYNSNVVNLYRSMLGEDKSPAQIGGPAEQPKAPTLKWYDPGVGTHKGNKFRGGFFGNGLSRNIREGYKFLIDNYEPGDEIYLFGFSRGSYTARSLAGLIRKISIVKREHAPNEDPDENVRISDGYELYRYRDASPDSPIAEAFREKYSWSGVKIKFLGVWDTVGSLGIPLESYESLNDESCGFHDTKLSRIIENAYHAAAIDEHRHDYQATLWEPISEPGQKMEQVWFVGAHSDVGGGSGKTALSEITLRWMREKAMLDGQGLEFADIGEPTQDFLRVIPSDPWKEFHFFMARLSRGIPNERNYRQVGATRYGNETVHDTAEQKIELDNRYKPGNLGLWNSRFQRIPLKSRG
jgi:uncharacterized protein (DUF2235 family)